MSAHASLGLHSVHLVGGFGGLLGQFFVGLGLGDGARCERGGNLGFDVVDHGGHQGVHGHTLVGGQLSQGLATLERSRQFGIGHTEDLGGDGILAAFHAGTPAVAIAAAVTLVVFGGGIGRLRGGTG